MVRAISAMAKPDRDGEQAEGGSDDLVTIAHRFEVLQGQLNLLNELSKDVRGRRELIEELDGLCEKRRNRFFDEMTVLSWNAVSRRSENPDHWRAKAHILLEWCVPQDGDIVHCLAASLCKDICKFWGPRAPGEGPQCNRVGDDKAISTRTGGTD